ncbi:AEC family transporter [Vibrio sp. CAU 1672]|uniref:AEC family transporter n=1 Tax=Vibrio sp. CAU 1672 TaxID=3032594 RepID=UPI0023DB1BFB|nr:AEC family transporter [Vibrio sp. CAU 1672]MDF2153442.1 AEC family transporter [Vibrio sp. CAU 1672]
MSTETQLQYVVSTILPVFVVIGLGYLAFKARVMPENGHRALAAFVFNFGLPAAIFSALSTRPIEAIWNSDYILVYTLGSLMVFALVLAFSFFQLKKPLTEGVILGLGSSFSNSLLIGFPIIYFLFGHDAMVPFSLTLIVENLILLPLILTLADLSAENGNCNLVSRFVQTAQNLAKNPIVLAISGGLLVSALSLEPPEVAVRVVDMLAKTVTGIALFTIGGGLLGVRAGGMKKEISTVVISKLFLHPLLLLMLILVGFDLEPTMSAVAVILASMPMFGVYAVIGQKYNMGGICSAVLLPTTLVSTITISAVTTITIIIFNL